MAAPMRTWRFLTSLRNSGILNRKGSLRCFSGCSRDCADSGGRWQLFSAVCLERPAVVVSESNEREQEYGNMLQSIEFERALLSDHEIRHKEDMALAERRRTDDYEDTEAEALRVTALEDEDTWEAQLAKFTPAPRTTVADENGDKTTHARELERKLTLLVRQTLGNQEHWVLPQGSRRDDETMRETAERVLEEKCGPEVKARFLGNAPVGFYKYKFMSGEEGDPIGAKVFFFKAQLEGGSVEALGEDISEVAWVTKEEMGEFVAPPYRQRVSRFLMDL